MKKNKFKGKKTYLIEASDTTVNSNYTTHVLFLNQENQLGIEFDWSDWIRIDVIKAENVDTLRLMLTDLKELAKQKNYPSIRYADAISEEYAEALIENGFIEIPDIGDSYFRYFWFYTSEKE